MIEEDFYATIKFRSGEEIFAKVAASEEQDRTMLLVSNPVVIEEVKMRNQCMGYKFEHWIKTSSEDMYIMNFKATGNDWKRRNIYTLRHATGCEKYIK